MRRALVVVAAIVVVLAAIAAFAPAALVGVAVERLSRGAVSIAESDGTVWHGRGTLDVQGALRLPLEWRVDLLPLARGEARMTVAPPAPATASPRADLSARRDAVTVRALDVAFPAEAIAALAPRAGVRLEGELRLSSPSLEWTRSAIGGAARVRWSDARFAIGNEAPLSLGNVEANLVAADGRLAGPVTNEGGDFDVRGTLSLAASGAPDVALTLSPRGGSAAQGRSLRVASRPDGGWNVEYRAGMQ
jgi:hypothetical protein